MAHDEGLEMVQERFLAGLKSIVPDGRPSAPHAPEPLAIGGFAPLTLAQLLAENEPLAPDWILEDLIAAGTLAGLIAKPKVGKTTLTYELAVHVAKGQSFLGRATKRGGVLILAMEEHRREIKRRLRDLSADQIDSIHVHTGPLTDSADTLHLLQDYIRQHSIVLVIFDTLNAFWSVSEENDAGAVTQAIKPLLQLARDSGAAVLLIHHARKSEGEHGDEIRGSGALFSLLDVALILKRHDVETQRRLVTISRYAESPPELLLELREHGYVSLGDPAASSKAARLAKMVDALTDTPLDAKALAVKAGLSQKSAYTLLDLLHQQGRAVKGGTGKKNDPFVFSKMVSVSSPKRGGPEETNSDAPSLLLKSSPPNGGFVASYPSTLGVDRKETNSDVVADSLLPPPAPPGRNELEEVVEI
jgi:hypothetical protein